MPSYSSSRFAQDWRYTVEQEFSDDSGQPFQYAEKSHQSWGDELIKLHFETPPEDGCFSGDGSLFAVAIKNDVHVINTATWETVKVLKGHASDVKDMAFKPDDSNVLVTESNEKMNQSDDDGKSTIVVWKLDDAKTSPVLDEDTLISISKAGVSAQAAMLSKLGLEMSNDEMEEYESAIKPSLEYIVAKLLSKDKTTIHGRLSTSFQSNVFSPSGKWMVYLPKNRPTSNDVDVWDMNICSTDDYKDKLTLTGHTDNIMWTGWNHDESLFGSVAWDGSIRIWDANTGQQLHKFTTDRQNWTGDFSPDSGFFAATDGHGHVLVYALQPGHEGKEHWNYSKSKDKPTGWRRAMSWHPNSKLLAVGGDSRGEVLLLDVEKKELVQERTLSFGASKIDEEHRRMMTRFVGVSQVKYVENGSKLVLWHNGDGSIEVYDFARRVKWRFARGGTEDGPNADAWRDEDGKVTSGLGNGMLVAEDQSQGQLLLASLDADGVRIWNAT